MVAQLDHLFESIVDENEADERREAFLSETCEVLHQEAGVCGDQHQTEKARPQANPQPKLKVVEGIVSEQKVTDLAQMDWLIGYKCYPYFYILFPSNYNPPKNPLHALSLPVRPDFTGFLGTLKVFLIISFPMEPLKITVLNLKL